MQWFCGRQLPANFSRRNPHTGGGGEKPGIKWLFKLIQANDCKEQKSAWNTWKNEYADLLRVEIKTFGVGVPTLCLCSSAAWFVWQTAVSNKMFGTNYYGGNVYHPRPWIKWHTPCSPLLGKVSKKNKKQAERLKSRERRPEANRLSR